MAVTQPSAKPSFITSPNRPTISKLNAWAARLGLIGLLAGLAGDTCGTAETRIIDQSTSTEVASPPPIPAAQPSTESEKKDPSWKVACMEKRKKAESEKMVKKRWQPAYEILPEYAGKMSREEFEDSYKNGPDIYEEDQEKDKRRRYMLILRQIVAGNAEANFHTIEIREKDENGNDLNNGSVLKMRVISGLKVHGLTAQLDGPAAMTAAKLLGGTLPTKWMVDQIYDQAKKSKGFIPFISYPDICKSLKIECDENKPPDKILNISPEFAMERDILLAARKKELGVPQDIFSAGFFKDTLHPTDTTPPSKLSIYGGRYADGSLAETGSQGHHIGYSDYSHGVTVILKEVEMSGQKMELWEFYANPDYGEKFGFEPVCLGEPYMTPFLWKFVEENKAR